MNLKVHLPHSTFDVFRVAISARRLRRVTGGHGPGQPILSQKMTAWFRLQLSGRNLPAKDINIFGPFLSYFIERYPRIVTVFVFLLITGPNSSDPYYKLMLGDSRKPFHTTHHILQNLNPDWDAHDLSMTV